MSPADGADLGRCRRGVEPLRIVMPQYDRQVVMPAIRTDASRHRGRRPDILDIEPDDSAPQLKKGECK
jgi:hypothetical protein